MLAKTITATAMLTMFSAAPALGQEVTDYLGVPGPIEVGETDYVLSWSSNPSDGYYKQEYLPVGAAPESYESMVIVEFLATDMPVAEVVAAQVQMVNARKASDPVANVAVLQNDQTSELVLDFLMSAKDDNGEFIVEWNGYRYVEAEFDGKRGSLLFAVSERAYGNDSSEAFLGSLRDFKSLRILDLTKAELPELD